MLHCLRVVLAFDSNKDGERAASELRCALPNVQASFVNDERRLPQCAKETDILILQCPMRNTDALTLAETAKKDRPELPIILYSAPDFEDISANLKCSGLIDDYILNGSDSSLRLRATLKAALARAERSKALRKITDRYRSLFEDSPIGLLRTNAAGRIIDVNAAAVEMLAYPSRQSLLSTNAQELYADPEDRRRMAAILKRNGLLRGYETQYSRYDGRSIWVRYSGRLIEDEKDGERHYDGVLEDITERKLAQEALQKSEEHYRFITDNIRDVIWTADTNLHFTYFSPEVVRMSGYSLEEAQACSVADSMTPTSFQTAQKVLNEGVSNAQRGEDASPSRTLELELIRKDGSTFWAEVNMTISRDSNGAVTGLLGVTRDISDRKRTEDEIIQRNKELSIINIVTSALSKSLDFSQLLGSLKSVFSASSMLLGGGLFLYESNSDCLTLQKKWGKAGLIPRSKGSMPVSGLSCECVIREKEPAIAVDGSTSFFLLSKADKIDENWVGSTCLPLIADGEVLGVAELITRTPLVPGPDRIPFLRTLGQQIGAAMQKARLLEQLRASHLQLQNLSHELVCVQEAERRALARELHDEVGGTMTAVSIALELCSRSCTGKATQSIEQAKAMISDLVNRIHELTLDLRPALLDDAGLVPALLCYFDKFTAQTQIIVDFERANCDRRMCGDVETCAFRIVQEALTNIARYSGADKARVSINIEGALLIVDVTDQGRGFDLDSVLASGRASGLTGMRERVAALGGVFELNTSLGSGTRIHAMLPIEGKSK